MSLLLINFTLTNMELLSEFVAYKAVYNCLHVERELINGFAIYNYGIYVHVCGNRNGFLAIESCNGSYYNCLSRNKC